MRDDASIWAYLIHIGYNMWKDWPVLGRDDLRGDDYPAETFAVDFMLLEDAFYRDLTQKAVDSGANTLVLDLGEGIRYDSAPELAVDGSWSKEKLDAALTRLREIGIEPIPKLNFSACHDNWLGVYARQISTEEYYRVASNIVSEVCELFGKPRFFHLGFDEEDFDHQAEYEFVSYRQGELWWDDLRFFLREVEKNGVRPWIWSDQYWRYPKEFLKNVPRSVLQSNWFYCEGGATFDSLENDWLRAFLELDQAGFEQIPTGSTWAKRDNFPGLVDFCDKNISSQNLLGYCQTVWKPTIEKYRDKHFEALDFLAEAKKNREKRSDRRND